jgi:hypothetical protein
VTYVGSEVRSDTRGNEPQNSHKLLKTEAHPKIRRLATPAAHESANSGAESPSDIDRASVVNRQGGVRDGELSAGLHTARSGNGITEAGDGADDNGFPDLPPEFDRRPKPTPEPPALNGDDRIVF